MRFRLRVAWPQATFSARMILMLAAGRSYAEIQERLQTTAPTISRWKKRFLESGVSGLLEMRHPGQKPR